MLFLPAFQLDTTFDELPFELPPEIMSMLTDFGLSTGVLLIIFLLASIIFVVNLVTWWLIFEKAGHAGWKMFIPILNIITMLRVGSRPWWWIFLFAIPIVNIVCAILWVISLGRSFHKGTLFIIGMFILPGLFYLILAFDSSTHEDLRSQTQRKFHETGEFDMSQYLPAT